jgi:hypothetical protein
LLKILVMVRNYIIGIFVICIIDAIIFTL